ncbi:EamA family transporter RarD [Paraburkholderia sp. BL10I2N1]|uniref:EamA family transporter RarD n=1 Tax=Paraburkholderia sp. BL10I2N1 TaxID=1938796 RepID=UPI00105EE9E4|nr:EamA family transporter RarD [Paraburkholderia sp. BL10I2N1]TDN61456.1 chloramphenicol-sensitive protein RarD [Paraburkholderia sp. BL10I2N1]
MLKGVALSITATSLFAGLYYYSTLLHPLTGELIFGWRMVLMMPCITVFLIATGEWSKVKALCFRIRKRPQLFLYLVLSSALLGSQQWLFMWAPLNGQALNVSMGYFLLPLVMLLVGRYFYKERLSGMQKLAAASAAIGVANEFYQVGGVSWTSLFVCLGFPAYFALRRRLNTAHLGGLWFDVTLTLPAAFCFVSRTPHDAFSTAPHLSVLLCLLAIISAAAFMAYTAANRLLPFGLFGLLGYVEPVLMVMVSLMLGERIHAEQWLTYIPIWIAVLLLAAEGGINLAGFKLKRRALAGSPCDCN